MEKTTSFIKTRVDEMINSKYHTVFSNPETDEPEVVWCPRTRRLEFVNYAVDATGFGFKCVGCGTMVE